MNKGEATHLWFQITMYNAVVPHECQRLQHLTSEPANQCGSESDKVIGFDQLVEVDTQQFRCNAEMTPEVEVFRHFDNMMFLVRVLHMSSQSFKFKACDTRLPIS